MTGRGPGALTPAEHLALTVASAQLRRGINPGPNTTAVLVLALERIAGPVLPFPGAPAPATPAPPDVTGVRPKVVKTPGVDCLGLVGVDLLSCDLPAGHDGSRGHYDAEYQVWFGVPGGGPDG